MCPDITQVWLRPPLPVVASQVVLDGPPIITPTECRVTKVLLSGPPGPPGPGPYLLEPYSYGGTLNPKVGTFRLYNDTGADRHIGPVRASVGTAPTGDDVVVDILRNGVSLYLDPLDRPAIAAGTNTVLAPSPGEDLAVGDFLTVDIVSVGTVDPGADLVVTIVLS